MARLFWVLYFVVLLGFFVPSTEARKLLRSIGENKVMTVPALEDSLVLSALPKSTTPPSAPSKKGHLVIIDEKLFAMHLATIDRILRSVPSPGVGH
ncbi:hypothetical protein Scep_027787 [Stephania cephalantha]|uniref:Uncharacterized protein n=1 Tax=Stephania cephalantha TaxID=152367 RepID=A0AAP0E8L0_9MAGN